MFQILFQRSSHFANTVLNGVAVCSKKLRGQTAPFLALTSLLYLPRLGKAPTVAEPTPLDKAQSIGTFSRKMKDVKTVGRILFSYSFSFKGEEVLGQLSLRCLASVFTVKRPSSEEDRWPTRVLPGPRCARGSSSHRPGSQH